jgi:hypothetical protein
MAENTAGRTDFGAYYFPTWARQQRVGNPLGKAILCQLAIYAEASTGVCFPSEATLADVSWSACACRPIQ